jgi:hypothetical protein
MEVEQQALLQAWWTKSCHDLAAVRLLLAAEPPALAAEVLDFVKHRCPFLT